MGIIDYNNNKLQLSVDIGFSLKIDATGAESEQENAFKEGLLSLEKALKMLKQQASESIETFESPEEKEAITAWCEKHSYKVAFVGRSSIDIWHP